MNGDLIHKFYSRIIVVFFLSVSLCTVCVGCGKVQEKSSKEVALDDEDGSDAESDEGSDDVTVAEDQETTDLSDTNEPEKVYEEYGASDDGSKVYICTAPQYVILQRAPGQEEEDEDDQTRLYAGTYLKWYGVEETVDNKRYIQVTVKDTGEEGWIEYLYGVEVKCDPDISGLDIVETDNVLYTYDMMCRDIDALCDRYGDVLHKSIIGSSNTGMNLYEITLGDSDAKHHVMVQASIHGREYMNTQLVMKLLEYYAHFYNYASYNGVKYADLFNNTAFHVVTMANPDGVTISQLGVDALGDPDISDLVYEAYERDKETLVYEENSNGDLTWMDYYKDKSFKREDNPNASRMITYEEYQTIWKANGHGVDLNNNFDAAWDDIDLKWNPSYGSFKGYSAVSEPETKALADMVIRQDYECYLSYHSTGQLIYYDCEGNSETMSDTEKSFAEFMQDRIHHRTSNNKSAYNVNLGGFGDWIQLSLNKPSLTIESGKKPCPLPIGEFAAIWLRHRESWAALAGEFY